MKLFKAECDTGGAILPSRDRAHGHVDVSPNYNVAVVAISAEVIGMLVAARQ